MQLKASPLAQKHLSDSKRSVCPPVWLCHLASEGPVASPAAYLFKYGVDPVHLAVNHIALLLPPVHLFNDAPELRCIRCAANGTSGDLPVVSHRCLHDGLQY